MRKLLLLLLLIIVTTAARAETVPNCKFMKREKTALACTIYYEARGSTFKNKLGVALVALNRSRDWEKPLVYIIKQKNQFTYLSRRDLTPKEIDAWRWSLTLATFLLAIKDIPAIYGYIDVTYGAKYYVDKKVNVAWLKNLTPTVQLDNHVYYKDKVRTNTSSPSNNSRDFWAFKL